MIQICKNFNVLNNLQPLGYRMDLELPPPLGKIIKLGHTRDSIKKRANPKAKLVIQSCISLKKIRRVLGMKILYKLS